MDGHEVSAYAVVLAGGTGTRMWPYSRRSRPKQLLPLIGERSLLQATVERLAPYVPPEHVVVVTNAEYVPEVRRQLPEVPAAQVIGEPSALGTAAAVGLGAAVVGALDSAATMFVLPADHIIEPRSRFHADLARAEEVAATGRLVTFGIPPTGPETGYGYVEIGDPLPGDAGAYDVVRFVEKPDRDTAEEYAAGGRHLWNSGMFAWTVPAISSALAKHLPDLAARVAELTALDLSGGGQSEKLAEVWARITDRTTIDYGVTFERGIRIRFGDRSHLHISGTASIDKCGEIVHPGDILKQTERTVANI
ncbi:MAG: sugar phosphate nucleotidyltransferase, partial [Anaerolineae bacterium]